MRFSEIMSKLCRFCAWVDGFVGMLALIHSDYSASAAFFAAGCFLFLAEKEED